MADGREDRETNFQFIEEVQNCPDLWDVSSAAYKKPSVFYAPRVGFILMYDFVQTFLFFQRVPFYSSAIDIQ